MYRMPNLRSCNDLIDGNVDEQSSFSFAKAPISTLQFTGPKGLTSENFERLCCRLMAKLYNLHGYRRFGSGKNQQGIDIYGYRSSPESLVVIQCKCHADFDLSKLKKAIREFREGSFCGNASEFIIMMACNLLPASVEEEAIKVRHELSAKHCLFDIWNGERISEELKSYPEIVEAFYRQDVVQALCQPWGVRQRLLEILQKACQDQGSPSLPDAVIPEEEKDDVASFLTEKTVSLSGYKQLTKSFNYHDAFIGVSGRLPVQKDYFGSCLINVKQSNLRGCAFVLGHSDIVNTFIKRKRTPPTSKYRRFFVHEFEVNDRQLLAVDLRGSRLYLHKKSFYALCDAVDTLADAYTNALKQVEESWGAQRFPFAHLDSVVVSLGHMPAWVWEAILRFAARHDAGTGNSEWHIFEASGLLKIYTMSQSKSLNPGYHALISAVSDATSSGRWVRLFWRPPSMYHEKINERDFWPCELTFSWLRDKLIPKVLREVWLTERGRCWTSRGRQRHEAEFRMWLQDNQIIDPRSPHLTSVQTGQGMSGLWVVVSELQRKYSINRLDFPVSGEIVAGIYTMLSLLASRAEMTYWGYVSEKLELAATDKSAIINEIERKRESIRLEDDATWRVDEAMRAAMELVDNGNTQLASDELDACFGFLRPISEIFELSDLIDRHMPRGE